VWIEDTDAYGIVYHANYLRFIERAAHALLGRERCSAAFDECAATLGLTRVEGVKYNHPAVLGDLLHVRLATEGIDADCGTIRIAAAITRAEDGTPIWSCSQAELAFTIAGTGERAPWPLRATHLADGSSCVELFNAPSPPPPPLAAPEELPPTRFPLDVTVEADELPPTGQLSLLAALRYFERQRSQAIGGADKLKELQDSGTSVVVARMRFVALAGAAKDGLSSGKAPLCSSLTARCSVTLRARSTQVVFDQWLIGPARSGKSGGGSARPVLARAEVTCMCIDPASRKIVPASDHLRALLVGGDVVT